MRCFPVFFLWEISFSEITGALKVGINLNSCFSRGRAVPGETKVSTNVDIKNPLGAVDKKARQWGTGLKRNMRKAVQSFNGAKLSAKVHPVDPHVMAQTTEFARSKVNELDRKMQEGLNNPQRAQSPRVSSGSSTGRAHVSGHADRQSKASNETPLQTSDASRTKEKKPVNTPSEEFVNPFAGKKPVNTPSEDFVNPFAKKKQFNTIPDDFVSHFKKVNAGMAIPQPARHQTPSNVTHRQQSNRYEHVQMSEAEARRIADRGVPYDSPDVEDALDLVARARQVLDEIQAKKDRSKLKKEIDEALNPGGRNTRVSRAHAELHQEQIACERILAQEAHYDMGDRELGKLWDEQKSAGKRLEELERFAVFDNTRNARMHKVGHLLHEMDKIENALNKMERKHPDFDNHYLSLSNDQLAKQRANLHNKFAQLSLDYNMTRCEGIVARWAYEMESGERTLPPHRMDRILKRVNNAYEKSKNMGYGSDDRAIIKARVENLAKEIEKIKGKI